MSKAKKDRKERLLPKGEPRYVRIYDNAGLPDESYDHLTVVFSGRYRFRGLKRGDKLGGFKVLSMNDSPFHPMGFCQHEEYQNQIDTPNGAFPPAMGRKGHLGRRIPFSQLNKDCQKIVLRDYIDIWGLYEIGEGFREVKVGEIIKKGDEEYKFDGYWYSVSVESIGNPVEFCPDPMFRRKVS